LEKYSYRGKLFGEQAVVMGTTTLCKNVCDRSAGRAVCLALEGRGSNPEVARCFSSLQRPGQFWGPLSLLSNVYRGRVYCGIER
jgi:hypothetical protein